MAGSVFSVSVISKRPVFELSCGFFFLLGILLIFARADLVAFVGILLSIAAHEGGHMIPALLSGTQVKAIGANLAGCYMRRQRAQSRIVESVIISGGLLVTLLIALETRGVVRLFNWCLLLANVMPSPWSDGGRLVRTLKRAA